MSKFTPPRADPYNRVGPAIVGAPWFRKTDFGTPPRSRIDGTGQPSAMSDTMSSEIMSMPYDEDDAEYFREIDSDPPYDVLRNYVQECLCLEESHKKKKKKIKEFMTTAAVAGYTLPLGMSNPRSKKNRKRFTYFK